MTDKKVSHVTVILVKAASALGLLKTPTFSPDSNKSKTEITLLSGEVTILKLLSYAPVLKLFSYAPVCVASSAATPSLCEESHIYLPQRGPRLGGEPASHWPLVTWFLP